VQQQDSRRSESTTTRPRHPMHPIPHSARRLAFFTRHRAASTVCNRDAATHRLIVMSYLRNGDRLDSVTSAVSAAYTRRDISASSDSHALASTNCLIEACLLERSAFQQRYNTRPTPISPIVPAMQQAARHIRTRFDHDLMPVPRSWYRSDAISSMPLSESRVHAFSSCRC
jgi:hypothetical protein